VTLTQNYSGQLATTVDVTIEKNPGGGKPRRLATIELTAENFDSTASGAGLVLVDFWAAWCSPYRMFGPVFERVSPLSGGI
jgi:thioredoxin-like negative regulator of GroEL